MGVASQNSRLPCTITTFPVSLSLSSPGDVATSTSYFLLAAMNLRPPSATVSTHTSAFNAVAFQSPAMPNARMSLCTQSVHYFSFPLRPLRTAPSKVANHDSLWQPPAAHSDERPRPQKSSRAQRCLNDLAPSYLKGMVVRGRPMVWSLVLCPDDAKQDPVVYGAEFGVVFLAEGPRTASIKMASIVSAFTIRVLRKSATFGWL